MKHIKIHGVWKKVERSVDTLINKRRGTTIDVVLTPFLAFFRIDYTVTDTSFSK